MEEFWIRTWHQLFGRISGPLSLRLILQPTVAAILAIRAGARDARRGRPPYFCGILSTPSERYHLLHDGWKDIGKVFLVACALDVVYQVIVHRWFYTIQTLIVATVLSIVPYVLIRGPVTRLARWLAGRKRISAEKTRGAA